jgi:formylglycine-generating enzyme required for sulfatase activity/dienelactone hydrolase
MAQRLHTLPALEAPASDGAACARLRYNRGKSMTGRTVAHYEILEQIGAGGMGVVFKARDMRLDRFVALKFLAHQSGMEAEDRARLFEEARAASHLDHPNVGVVHGIEEDSEGHLFIVMAHYDGDSLRSRIAQGMEISDAIRIGRQIAAGLESAHRHGIVHRDIKPSNILITSEGDAKIIDFGLAKLRDATLTAGSVAGTVAYMSPEQASGQTIEHRTDIWSFGAVLYEMITGRRAFAGDTPAVISAIVLGKAPHLRDVRSDLPPELDQIVAKCLEKDLSRRYQSAAEAGADLDALASSQTAAAMRPLRLSWGARVAAVVLLVMFVAAIAWFFRRDSQRRWARDKALPDIERLAANGSNAAALALALEARKLLPGDRALDKVLSEVSRECSIQSEPPGAQVEIKEYGAPGNQWKALGTTPLSKVRVPAGYLRWRLSKAGFLTASRAFLIQRVPCELKLTMDPEGSIPAGMVRVPGGRHSFSIAEFGIAGPYDIAPYLIDQDEVTNRQFKAFMDQGGYSRREFWKHAFRKEGRTLTWEDAMALLRDATGRPGPAMWEGGRYPDGQDDYPVGGVSWYEAAAYAEFAGRSLPSVFHWYTAADLSASRFIVPLSNMGGTGPAPVGKHQGVGTYGTSDMAGNVREWCWNEAEGGERYILGGTWNQPAHMFTNNADIRAAFDRSAVNGFRCVLYSGGIDASLLAPKVRTSRDYGKEKAVNDEAFRAYLGLFDYDKTELNLKLESVEDTADWRKEKVTFDAVSANDRMILYVFTPKNSRPPYQTVIYFPGAGAAQLTSSRNLEGEPHYSLVVKSGRALLYPVYWGTYERRSDRALQRTPSARRERGVNWVKDLNRTIDYLETRQDLDRSRIGYVGFSQGSWPAPVFLFHESRIKTAILLDGGFSMQPYPAEVDPINYAPRVKTPILMLNGRYDFTFPYATSQVPMFRMLGTPEHDKRHVVLETAHDVNVKRTEMTAELLGWLDKYLGKVR